MAANISSEQWHIKENGGSGELVGIASTGSKWFIAEEVLRDNAELICRLFNEQAADTKVQNFNSLQQLKAEIAALIPELRAAYGLESEVNFENCLETLRQLSAV